MCNAIGSTARLSRTCERRIGCDSTSIVRSKTATRSTFGVVLGGETTGYATVPEAGRDPGTEIAPEPLPGRCLPSASTSTALPEAFSS